MARPKLTLYCDILSPFAYMAFYMTRHSPVFKECDITYIPILLGGVLKACNNTPPLNIKNKATWINLERSRWSQYLNIPIYNGTPEGFPASTVLVQRALCAIQLLHPARLAESLDALYRTYWVEGNPINKPDVIAAGLESVFSDEEVKVILAKAGDSEVKKLLLTYSDQAVKDGAFGLPWFLCTNAEGVTEGFWGVDHLGQVVQFLGLDRKVDSERFRALL